jgi:hypothetical protein
MLRFERDRMFLKCFSCGHESPGWTLNKTRPNVETCDTARRAALSPQLIGVRRIA